MEWKNYLELDPNRDLYTKYLLNIDENLGSNYPYYKNNNINYFKKYFPNYPINNFQTENNSKINYFNLMQNSPYDSEGLEENIYLAPMNYEEDEGKKINKLSSDLTNNENKEITNKKNKFKIQTFSSTSKDDSKNNSEDINNSNINNNTGINYLQNIPLKERMKIKKEKTKKLLENKTLRSKTDEESKENNIEKNSILNNSGENNFNLNINNDNILDKNTLSKLSKKEIKMWRNRLSAQRSRDRKKKELSDLKAITKSLLQENEKLRNVIKERDEKINQLMNILCPQCKNKLNEKNNFEITIKTNLDNLTDTNDINLQDKNQLTPSTIIGGKKKLALFMTGLFTIFCVFGTLINPGENNILRNLKEKGGNKTNNTKLNFDVEKRVNVPFLIEKDYSIRHQKEIEMYQKIKKYNLKNKNMMVPASLFTNNSEQIISNISNKVNNNNNNTTEEKKEEINNNNKMIEEKNNNFLSNGKIKIIEKDYSTKENDDIKNENVNNENMK